jgi:hypothetical protein
VACGAFLNLVGARLSTTVSQVGLLVAINTDGSGDRSPPGLSHERLTSDVSLDELGDQLRIAVVEGVCTGDSDGVDVRQHGKRPPITFRVIADPHRAGVDQLRCYRYCLAMAIRSRSSGSMKWS